MAKKEDEAVDEQAVEPEAEPEAEPVADEPEAKPKRSSKAVEARRSANSVWCPTCDRSYPLSVTSCEVDGTVFA